MKKIKSILFWFFAVVGFIVVSLIGTGIYFATTGYESQYYHQLPGRMIITFDVADGVGENEGSARLIDFWNGNSISTRKAVLAIRAAAGDDRVDAIAMRVDNVPIGLAKIQELREAIMDFRASGKKAYAYADTFGIEGSADNAYYLAAAFDEIWMQPSGDWGVVGISMQMPFLRGLLDKIGVQPIFAAREEYKSAMSFLTEYQMTAADKSAMQQLADDVFGQKISAIAKDRGIDPEKIRQMVDESPISSGQALAANVIDTAGYATQLLQKLNNKYGKDAELVHLADYAATITPEKSDPRVAVIYAVGEVQRGSHENSGSHGLDDTFYADDVAWALRQAAEDKDIKAIVIRIDSPGGSYIASDTVWDAVMNAKKSGKPVIAVMGDVAASGGYFVAMAADKIYAMPATLTGSIGVIAGKVSVDELAKKLGVTFDGVKVGNNADMWAFTQDFSPSGRKKLEEFLDRSYADFLQKAAMGRGMTVEQMRAAAKGRVWTGQQAKELGLIDGIGGWVEAESDLRKRLGLSPAQEIAFEPYPKPKPAFEELVDKLSRYSAMADDNYEARISPMLMAKFLARSMGMDGSVQARMNWIATPLNQ